MFNWLKRLLCQHTGGVKFVQNLYEDQVVGSGYKRSEWRCKRCDATVLKDCLNERGGDDVQNR